LEEQAVVDRAPEPTVEITETILAPADPTPVQTTLEVADVEIEYASLTDLAREYNPDSPGSAIQIWLQNRNTMEFLRL